MFLKVAIISILGTLTSSIHGTPIIYNQPYNHNAYPPNLSRGHLTPPRAITTLNTFVPRALIPPAPPRQNIPPRVYEKTPPPRVYTAPPVFRPIQPAPTTRKPTYMHYTSTNPAAGRYAYNYSVNDNRTGDIKTVEERLENGVVRGSYSLVEPDGMTVRRVTYTADDVNGFVANVERTNRPLQPPPINRAPFTIFNP